MLNVDGSEESGVTVTENKEDVALLADEEAGQPKSEDEKTDEKTSSWNEFCEFINTSGKTDNDADAIPAGTEEAKEKKDDAVLLVADEEEGRPKAEGGEKTADDDDLAIAESGVEGKKEEEAALLADEERRPKFILPPNSEAEKTADDDDVAMAKSAEAEGVKWADQQAAIQKRESLIIARKRSLGRKPLLSHHEEEEDVLHFRKRWRWYYAVFFFSTISLLFCFLQLYLPPPFGVMMTSAQIEEIGVAPEGCDYGLEHCICPRETICATNRLSIFLLTLARMTAFFDYPLYMMMFLSKCHNINNICRRTVLREWIDFSDMHKVHKLFGIIVGIETMSHSFFHMLRWGLNGDISLLRETRTGVTGLIAMIITPLVCWPMVVPQLKTRMQFEVRKGLHYLAVVWAIALLWHAPSRIYYLIGIPALIYAVDYFLGFFIRNSLVENAHFERICGTSVALYFKNPQMWGDKPKTSYVYIMCPWISKYQWHAFTMFPEPTKENHTMLCIGASGDWTKELHSKITVPSFKSLYVQGPYLSEFSDKAVTTSNAIAVASGIGITPTLSLMLNYAGKKRVNIIWMCRDAGLVEYILHKFDIDEITRNAYAFIFYTGKRELALPRQLPVNVFIFTTRPNLEENIAGIITAIHSGDGLPEELYEMQSKLANASLHKRMQVAFSRVIDIYGADEMFEFAAEETEKEVRRDSRIELDMLCEGLDPEAAPLKLHTRHSQPDSPLDAAVSLEGLNAMISEFCGGIGVYSMEELEETFNEIDRDGSGFITREDFDAFLALATSEDRRSSIAALGSHMDKMMLTSIAVDNMLSKAVTGQSLHGQSLHGQSLHGQSLHGQSLHGQSLHGKRGSLQIAVKTIQSLMNESDSKDVFQDWSIFYCGGSNAIKNNLKEISKKYGLAFAVEKFDW